jgi:hypothetical protein
VDETYVKVAGKWRYVYRAVDQHSQVIDVYVSKRRNTTAARRFFDTVLVETDHGRLKARLRPMCGLKRDRTASVVIRGHAFIQNLRRGHYELDVNALNQHLQVAADFDELAEAIWPRDRGSAPSTRPPDRTTQQCPLLSVFGSSRPVEAELAHRFVWRLVRRTVRRQNPDRPDLHLPARPMRRHHYLYGRDRFLTKPHVLEALARRHREIATGSLRCAPAPKASSTTPPYEACTISAFCVTSAFSPSTRSPPRRKTPPRPEETRPSNA